jgi:signal peptidase I
MTTPTRRKHEEETNVVETVQSLILAFALAMAVRSFVTEGFVIPTGSMAPTLMGQHLRLTSPATGYTYPVDAGPAFEARGQPGYANFPRPLFDPMLSVSDQLGQIPNDEVLQQSRMGDRVLVLKFLYAFAEPERWDVVVFKQPPAPVSAAENFIKRLVGLPNEQLVIVDGDIFTAPVGAPRSDFRITRKPEHVQRTVWQEVHNIEFAPVDPTQIGKAWGRPWPGSPWETTGFDLGARGTAREWRHDGGTGADGGATLFWRWDAMPITDFAPYNAWRGIPASQRYAVSDLRVSMAIEADAPEKLATTYTLETRRRALVFSIAGGKATLRVERAKEGASDATVVLAEESEPFDAPAAGRPFDVEFWHVDQRLAMWINGTEVVALDYAFESLEDRLTSSFNGRTVEDYLRMPVLQQPTPPKLSASFKGSPLTLHRVRVDRDLYYRPAILSTHETNQHAVNGPAIDGPAFGTDFLKPSVIGPDQFMMCGDNSACSRDSRLWGRPSRLVTETFGEDAPFVVPRPLLLGKAWSVYFPAPVSPVGNLPKVLPDFGELRFIR